MSQVLLHSTSRKSRRSVPGYWLHKPTGQARTRIDGRDIYLGIYDSPQSRQRYGEIVAKVVAGLPVEVPERRPTSTASQPGISVNELALAFMAHAQTHYVKNGKPTSEIHLFKMALGPLVELYGMTPAEQFGPLALKAVREQMVASCWVRNTVNSAVSRIRRVFRYGVENELVPGDMLQRLEAVSALLAGRTAAPDRARRSALPEVRISAVRELVSPVFRDLIDLQLLCGCRSGELLGLTTGGIDRSGATWVAVLSDHKTCHRGRERRLHFGPQAQLILSRYLSADPGKPLFTVRRTSFTRAITRACEIAFGMPEELRKPSKKVTPARLAEIRRQASEWRQEHVWTPHWLRHTAAAHYREACGLDAAQAVLGHASADMTERYSGLANQRAAAAVAALG